MNPKRMYFILQRELSGYFASPIAYVLIGVFLFFSGLVFQAILVRDPTQGPADTVQVMSSYLNFMAVILIFVGPILTARLIADESRSGTLELLLTSPLRDAEVVLGKFFGAIVLILIAFVLTLFYALAMLVFGGTIDWGILLTGYLGILLATGVYFSIGLFFSALTGNQVIAAVAAFIVALLFYIPSLVISTNNPGPVTDVINFIDLTQRTGDFVKGVIDLRYVIYMLSLMTFFLFLAIQAMGSRRWRAA